MRYFFYSNTPHTDRKFTLKREDGLFECVFECSGSFFNPYEYVAEDNGGISYECVSEGKPLFRTQTLIKNGEVFAKRSGKKISYNEKALEIDYKYEFLNHNKVYVAAKTRLNFEFEDDASMAWDVEDDLESIVMASCIILDAQYPLSRIYQ